jgi:hypothetical protein
MTKKMIRPLFSVMFLILLVIAHLIWISEQFAFTGFWDDTWMFVGHIEKMPAGGLGAISWMLDQEGDMAAPLIWILLAVGEWIGLQSNWLLILFANLAIVALISVLCRIAIVLGVKKSVSITSGLILYSSPALIDQRAWFVPIQHTLTVLFGVLGCYWTFRLLSRPRADNQIGFAELVSLNLMLLLVGLGREIGIPLSVLVLTVLLMRRPRFYQIVSLAWLLPLLIQLQRVFTNRLGTHVENFMGGSRFNIIRPSLNLIGESKPSTLLLLILPFIFLLQYVLIRRPVETNSPLPKNHWYLKSSGQALIVLRVVVLALCFLCIWLPRVGTPLLAITPPFAYLSNEYLFYFARWSHTQFELNVYWIGVVVAFVVVLTFRRALFLVVAIMSFLFTLPYLLPLTATFDVAKYVPATSITRYSVYFLPLAMCLLIHFWEQAFKFLESLLPRFQSVAQLLIPAVLGLVLLVGQLGPIEQRSFDYRSITPVVCSSDRFSVPSQSGDHFMKGYMTKYVVDPLGVLYDDYRIRHRPELVLRTVDIKNLDTTCNFPVNALLEALGPWVGGDSQTRLDQIKEQLGSQSENDLREDVFDVYRLMKSRGEI